MENNFFREAGDGSGGNASDGEPWGAADQASLTSCCAAWFLTGCGPGVGDPCPTTHQILSFLKKMEIADYLGVNYYKFKILLKL